MTSDTILSLHGFTGSGRDWDDLAQSITDDYTVIAPDIIGHGNAPKPDTIAEYHMENIAPALLNEIDEPVHLLGYSMGGRLALYLATHHPEKIKTLTLVSASPGLRTKAERAERRNSDNALAGKIENNGIEWFVEFWDSLSLWDSYSDELRAKVNARRRHNMPQGLANSLRGMGTGVMPSLWDKLPDLHMPVHLIVGELDTKFVRINQQMADIIPQCNLTILPNVGHSLHLEAPMTFKNTLLSGLK